MIVGEHPLKDAWRGLVWGPGRVALEQLPTAWELFAVRALGRAGAAALAGKRAAVRRNLERAFPERDDLDGVAREAFAAHFANQYLSFSFDKCTAHNWFRYLELRGLDELERARAQGHGVVIAHPHMGPAQLPLHVLGLLGLPMHQVGGGRVTLVELSAVGHWAARTRWRLEERMPIQLHDGKGYMRPLLRALAAGDVVMSACDATGGGEELGSRVVCGVLGQPMPIPVGAVWLAWKARAPLLTVHCVRNRGPGAPYLARIGPPLEFERSGPRKAVQEAGARVLAGWLEQTLSEHPGDWLFWDGFQPGGLLVEGP